MAHPINDGDDWLFTPGIALSKGKDYCLSFKCWGKHSSALERLGVTLGTSVKPEEHKSISADYVDYVTVTVPEERTIIFSVAKDCIYHIGFHCNSPKSMYFVNLDDIEIVEYEKIPCPEVVTDLKITPASLGKLQCDISFKAPLLDVKGNALQSLVLIDVYRSGNVSPIKTFMNPQPGEILRFVDEIQISGMYTYYVVAKNKGGKGVPIESTVYLGNDIPKKVSNVVAVETETSKVKITWDALKDDKGINGGYVDLSKVVYSVVDNNGRIIASNKPVTSVVDLEIPLSEIQPQQVLVYTVNASCNEQNGEGQLSNPVVSGQAYSAPMEESFAYATLTYYPWFSENIGTGLEKYWESRTYGASPQTHAVDEDAGLMTFRSYSAPKGTTEYFYSPKFDISSLKHPTVSFFVNHTTNPKDQDSLFLAVSNDNNKFIDIQPGMCLYDTVAGWKKYEVSLANFIGSSNFRIALKAISAQGHNIHVDDIRIFDDCTDLSLSEITFDQKMLPNQEFHISGILKNVGEHSSQDSTMLVLKHDGEVCARQMVVSPEIMEDLPFTFVIEENILKSGQNILYEVELLNDSDENEKNNVITFEKVCEKPIFPTIKDLSLTYQDKQVFLTWKASEAFLDYPIVTEGFETYIPFIIDSIGPWKVVDQDQAVTGVIKDAENQYDNACSPMAYQVYNPIEAGIDLESWFGKHWITYEGDQYLASMYNSDNTANDDWLISPLIASDKPVSFMATSLTNGYKPEAFEFLYSSTEDNPSDFVVLATEKVPAKWTKYTFNLPSDARYFAIRHITEVAYCFMLDNLSCAMLSNTPNEQNAKSYNIYRNNLLIAENVTSTNFVDDIEQSGLYNYKVTSVFESGESFYQESDIDIAVSIENTNSLDYELVKQKNGIILICEDEKQCSIADISGRIIFSDEIQGELYLFLQQGIYLICIDDKIEKFVVN